MKISGLTLFKLLPGGKKAAKSNCKLCGYPTCMAFAMKLAKGEAELDLCPHKSDELVELLAQHSGKKQQEISFGINDSPIIIGGESVLYRHDKTFVNPTTICIRIKTSENFNTSINKIKTINNYEVERIGEKLKINSIILEDDINNPEGLNDILKHLISNNYVQTLSIILLSESFDKLVNAYNLLKNHQKPLLYLKNANLNMASELEKETQCPVCIEEKNMEDLYTFSSLLEDNKIEQIVLTVPNDNKVNPIESLSLIRRSIVIDNCKPLRFPVLTFASDYCKTDDPIEEGLWAANLLCKYSNIIVLDNFNPAVIYSLFTLRQNLFTDPQKPLQIEAKLYEIGDVDQNSPVLITTNFALTYYAVASEIEASNIPCYLLITPSEGMSILTAWAASKFSGEIIAKTLKESNLESKIKHKNLIISGYVEILKEEIEEELPDWNVLIAPKEAVDIPEYLNNLKLAQV